MPLTDALAPHFGHTQLVEPTAAALDDEQLGDQLEPIPAATFTGSDAEEAPVPHHPLGIKPLGNKYLASGPDAKDASGTFLVLPDELLMNLLEYLDSAALLELGATCRFLYAFCTFDELWKSLALENKRWRPAVWHGTWRATLLAWSRTNAADDSDPGPPPRVAVDCGGIFSDVLHRPFACSHVNPARFAAGIPADNQIARLGDLTYEEFTSRWSSTPFVLTDCADVRCGWSVLRDWSLDALRRRHGATAFRAEAVDWPYALYDSYMRRTADESPLYLFDRQFAEKMGIEVGRSDGDSTTTSPPPAYAAPRCFGPDLFAVLRDERPAHRWLIVGPQRSGSTFHKDPNGTSAWNAVVRGAKYWVLFPPGAQVPGVFVSADKSEVTSPLSIAEWLLAFHAEARRTPGCVEGVCREGEVVHVPSGWWHLVVNLEPGIALTQNFVTAAHLASVLLFLRDRPEQVTGFGESVEDPYRLFVERLAAAHPAELAAAQAEMAARDGRRKRTWSAVVRGEEADGTEGEGKETQDDGKKAKTAEARGGGGFTFSFGGDDSDLEEEIP